MKVFSFSTPQSYTFYIYYCQKKTKILNEQLFTTDGTDAHGKAIIPRRKIYSLRRKGGKEKLLLSFTP